MTFFATPHRLLCVFICFTQFLIKFSDGAPATFTAYNPGSVTLPASTKTLKRLDSRTNCEATEVDEICTCSVSNNVPFTILWLDTDNGYYVYYDNSRALTPGQAYTIRVQCRVNEGTNIGFETLTVFVDVNQPPSIDRYPSDTVTFDANTKQEFSSIYEVKVTDVENDVIEYSMTAFPDVDYFLIGIGDGIIRSKIDMRSADIASHRLTVSVTDSFNTVNNFVVTVTITDLNAAPKIQGLPATVTLSEDAVAGDTIVNLVIDKPNLNPVCSSSSSNDNFKFTIDAGVMKVAYDKAFDYEEKRRYTISCTVNDGFLSSDGTDVLTLNIVDVNEPPEFNDDLYYCVLDEGTAGSNSCNLNLVITDPERTVVSTIGFLNTNNGSRFRYDSATDTVTFAIDYDIDQSGFPRDTDIILAAVDNGGATGTATVKIHVNDLNDNSCVTDNLKFFSLNQDSTLDRIGAFSQSDGDATSPNNEVYFETVSASPTSASDYFTITRSGEIYYTNLLKPSDDGSSFRVVAHCVDQGTPSTTSSSTIIVSYSDMTTTTTTTTTAAPTTTTTVTSTTTEKEKEKTLWDYEEFIATFAALMVLLAIPTLIGLAFLLWLICSGAICAACPQRPVQPIPQQRVAPYRPPPPRPQPYRPQPPPQPEIQQPPRLPPIKEVQPATNAQWENTAWRMRDDSVLKSGKSHMYHYH